MKKIKTIHLKKLFGQDDYDINLIDNTLVLVALNGSGKTTILQSIYYYLSGQWEALHPHEIEAIGLTLEEKGQEIKTPVYQVKDLKTQGANEATKMNLINKYQNRIGEDALEALLENINELQKNAHAFVQKIAAQYDVLEPLLNKVADEYLQQALAITPPLEDCHIVFMPTYRRIEHGLQAVFPDFAQGLSALLMSGVDVLAELQKKESKHEVDEEEAEEKIQTQEDAMLDQLQNIIEQYWKDANGIGIQEAEKNNISYEKVMGFGTDDIQTILLQASEKTEGVEQIQQLCAACNAFLVDKKLLYLSKVKQVWVEQEGIQRPLAKLSSGEKQLLGLFAKLIFSPKEVLLIIDEPELSLSMEWQEKLLPTLSQLEQVKGIITATHSPYIAQQMENYLFGLERFKVV